MKKLLLVVLLCPVWQGIAQEGELAFKLAAQKLASRKLSYTVTYKLYNAHQQGALIETQQMEVTLWENMSSIKNSLFHSILNDKYYLYTDHSRKLILLNYSAKKAKADKPKQLEEQLKQNTELDSLLKASYKMSLLAQKGDLRTYRLLLKNSSQYTHSDVTINTKENTVELMVLYYKKTLQELLGKHSNLASANRPRIEVDFSQYQFFTKQPNKAFSLDQYLTKSAKSYKPLPAYQSYQFINYTLKPKKR